MTAARLDVAMVALGLAPSRHRAQDMIRRGLVSVDGRLVTRPARPVGPAEKVSVAADPWVSRASHKLLGALDDTGLLVPPRCLDVGASTGGFTQVLLSAGAQRVYAVDVGHGQMAPPIAADPRVVVIEGMNAKELRLSDVGDEPVGLLVADLSFISLTAVLPALLPLVAPSGDVLLLVKPQFEVGRADIGSGVVRDGALRDAAVDAVAGAAAALGWREQWRGPSRLPGASGNIEFFLRLTFVGAAS